MFRTTLFSALLAASTVLNAIEPAVITIKAMTAQMKYDTAELLVAPGQSVKITLENADDLPHNMVFCQPGTDTAAMAMKQMENAEAALKRNWLPEDKRIWAHSKMLNPHEKEEFTFTAPEKAGTYPYVCTFPGHALTMRGELKVAPVGEGLKDLQFALYLGNWTQLPDFSKLKPHREGKVDDNLIQVKLDDYKNEFGVVFTGKLNAWKKGSYRFFLASDDGARILIDGKEVIACDGIHPAGEIKEKGIPLEKGEHAFRLEYFQGGGQIELYAAWKGTDFQITPLSKWLHPNWKTGAKKKKDDFPPIPLVVKDEVVIYRNFIQGAGNRGIGVGYPGGINIAWSAESMNLAVVWRGAFIDASRHWNSRGGGAQPPLGFDVMQPVGGISPALAILTKPDAPWPTYDPINRFEGFEWKGYTLDRDRRPVFRYEWNGLSVEDRFEAHGNAATEKGSLDRYIRFRRTGRSQQGSFFMLLSGDVTQGEANSFVLNKKLLVHYMGTPNPLLRDVGGAKQVLIPVPNAFDEALYMFSYSWLP